MNYLPLTPQPCLPEQGNHCSKNLSRKSSLSKHMLVVHEASRPSKLLQDRYLAKLMARRSISFAICYIIFKTRISFIENMKRGAHLLAPGPEDIKGGFVREFMLLLDGISVEGQIISTRSLCVASLTTGRAFATFPCQARGQQQLQEEDRHPLQYQLKILYVVF